MSLQTTLARADARQADQVWQGHRKGCPTCGPAARKRRYTELCPDGKIALSVREDLRKKAAGEAEADRAPGPGQRTLDRAALEDLLVGNVALISMGLADAMSYREGLGEEAAADAYGRLGDQLEEWIWDEARKDPAGEMGG